ncbi:MULTISPECIES: rhomboid family intramembrane serine protease [Myroides]|uniref:Rhomboid family intramembrane serine protease n=1 Tax=Myroides albus TaxID=2562892 RepID=A0A6I3LQW9_9FLAO|nr:MULTISPECIES: rhomboid family intramembrane serine protease [Myroides]MTG98572.1 rhomboid family intramembrane serine protease [Myroides albus]MVX36609.1 rhomboid family intramembrane serine protease [Myroides sp. LoEW2-1]UVD81336.1 rhomboid family intramembrane serine protease [Myroides albus]
MDISPVVLAIMAITGIVTYKGLNDFNFFYKYCFDIDAVRAGEKQRILTSGFLHVDWMHFIFNMMTLYFFGDYLMQNVGVVFFILIYFVSMIVGNLITYQMYQHKAGYRAVGASGAIMGVLYASIMINPDMMLGIFFIIPIPSYLFAILYLLYSVYGMRQQNDNIGHSAHIGGAIAGLLLILLKFPILIQQNLLLIGLMLVPIILLFILFKKGKL